MFSLNDDLVKFNKVASTLHTETMTLDERFMGGPLTIQDLLQQNRHIIEQMRKMKDVFLNYCKLNQKVYNKIIEHEQSANLQFQKIITIETQIEKKISNAVEGFEIAQQQAKKLNKESVEKIEEMQLALKSKVDQEGFANKIKRAIEEYDNEEQQQTTDKQQTPTFCESQIVHQQQREQKKQNKLKEQKEQKQEKKQQIKKKRKGLTHQDISKMKDEMTPLITQISNRVAERDLVFDAMKQDLTSLASSLHNLGIQSNQRDLDLKKLTQTTSNRIQLALKQHKKIIQKLQLATNQQAWKKKLNQFHTNHIDRPLQLFNHQLIHISEEATQKMSKLKQQTGCIDNKLKQTEQKLINISINIEEGREEALRISESVSAKHIEAIEIVEEVKKKQEAAEQKIKNELKSVIKEQQSERRAENQNLRKAIEEIVETTQQKVLRKVQIRFSKQLKQIRSHIVALDRKKAQIKNNLENSISDISNLKDVIAKKANYSDVISFLDRKADKNQYKDIQQIIKSPSHKSRETPRSQRKTKPFTFKSKLQSGRSAIIKASRERISHGFSSGQIFNFGLEKPEDKTNNGESKQKMIKSLKPKIHYRRPKSQRQSMENTVFLL